jgi:hypothetical protein
MPTDFHMEAFLALTKCRAVARAVEKSLAGLEYDKDASVRKHAEDAVANINRLAAADAYFSALGLAEGSVTRPFYDALVGFHGAAQFPVSKTWINDANEHEYYAEWIRLAKAPDAPGKDMSGLRRLALTELQPWAFVRSRRGPLPAIFLEAQKDSKTADIAWLGLKWCGAPGVEYVKAKAPNLLEKLSKELLEQLKDPNEAVRVAAAEGLGPLKVLDISARYALVNVVRANESPCVTRQAVNSLTHVTLDAKNYGTGMHFYDVHKKFSDANGDARTQAAMLKVLANLGLNGKTEARYYASVMMHPNFPEQEKDRAVTSISSRLEGFGKEVDSKTKQEFCRRWFKRHERTMNYPAKSLAAFASGHLRNAIPKICSNLGKDAKVLSPFLIKELDFYCFEGNKNLLTGYEAIQAIAAVGLEDSPKLRTALKDAAAYTARNPDDEKMKTEAQRLLKTLK